jgi:hypothetical protein
MSCCVPGWLARSPTACADVQSPGKGRRVNDRLTASQRRDQFGASLRAVGGLRRRRNEFEYPLYPTERASAAEALKRSRPPTRDLGVVDIFSQLKQLGMIPA